MPTILEVINKSAVMLQVREEHGNAVRVILGVADGPLVTMGPDGHIHAGPNDPEVRKAISGILQGVQTLGRLAKEGAAAGAAA